MKKILFGTLAAATLLGSVTVASAQYRGVDDGYSHNTYSWLTSPFDQYSGASIGYNRNIADLNNIGG